MQEQRLSVAGLWGLCAGDGLGLLARPKAVRNAQHGSLSVMRLLVAWHGASWGRSRGAACPCSLFRFVCLYIYPIILTGLIGPNYLVVIYYRLMDGEIN